MVRRIHPHSVRGGPWPAAGSTPTQTGAGDHEYMRLWSPLPMWGSCSASRLLLLLLKEARRRPVRVICLGGGILCRTPGSPACGPALYAAPRLQYVWALHSSLLGTPPWPGPSRGRVLGTCAPLPSGFTCLEAWVVSALSLCRCFCCRLFLLPLACSPADSPCISTFFSFVRKRFFSCFRLSS